MFLRFLTASILVLILPISGEAQLVRGQLLNGETNLPLEGALLVLQGPGGDVETVLSNASGRFLLRAPTPGTYTVRADRIGHASTLSDPISLAQGETVDLRMVAQVRAIELATLEVSGEARCDVRPEAGRAVALVWEEARKALSAAAHTDESGLYRYRTMTFLRELDKSGRRILSEQRRASQGYLLSPFESLPAETLMSQGFMKADPEGDLYYAPDARVLLSDPFLDTHCLGIRPGRGDNEGLLGVAFEPIPGRQIPDIRGVVWVEPGTARLRHVDYTYENLDPALRNEMVGGRVEFQGLPNGTWIVRDWRIRMPNAALAPDYRGSRQLILVGIREVGGEVARVQDQTGETILEAQRATLMGAVLDSTGVAPLVGARVEVQGTPSWALTGTDGSFSISGLSRGVYGVGFSHAEVPKLGGTEPAAEVSLTPGEVTSVTLVAPPLSTILTAVCGEDRGEDSAVLTGMVLDGETGAPLAGATVRVLWTDYRFTGTHTASGAGGWQTLAGMQDDGLQGESDANGRYLACSVPPDHPLRVEAESGTLATGTVPVRVPSGQSFLSHDISLTEQEEPATGGLLGLVVDFQDQTPLEGVVITLADLDRETFTNERGRFEFNEIPRGDHILEVNTLGRAPLSDTIQIRGGRLLELELRLPAAALELEGITVEVISRREMEFRQEGFAGGETDYITPEEMDAVRDRVTDIVDVIRSMGSPRIRITNSNSGGVPLGFCIRWTRREASVQAGALRGEGGCTNMLIVLDGMPMQGAGGGGPTIPATDFLMDLSPAEIESVQILSPVQARFQYGAGGDRGALIIKTRRGGRGG
jgi:hypothetical protein